MHPRDIYPIFEAIWVSNYSEEQKRFPLEQVMIDDCSREELENTASYLKHEIKKRQDELTNMKAIRSIILEVLEDHIPTSTPKSV